MHSFAKSYSRTHLKRPTSRSSGIKSHPDPRKYPRKPCLKSVFFNCGDQRYGGLIKNISRGGVFIETADKFLFGQSIELIIPKSRIVRGNPIPGWIVHLSGDGIGVTFKRIFERRSGRERRHAIDRRSGSDRRKSHLRKNRRKQKTPLEGQMVNYHT